METHDDSPARGLAGIPRELLVVTVACLIGALAFAYYDRSLQARWYAGPFILDYGWFNDLLSGRTLDLHNPSGVGDSSFYAVHVAPILTLFAGLARLMRLQGGQPAILFLSLGFAGAAAMGVVIVERVLRPVGLISSLAGGAIGGIAYGLNGVMRSTGDYPHIEIFYVPLALLTLFLLFQRRFVQPGSPWPSACSRGRTPGCTWPASWAHTSFWRRWTNADRPTACASCRRFSASAYCIRCWRSSGSTQPIRGPARSPPSTPGRRPSPT